MIARHTSDLVLEAGVMFPLVSPKRRHQPTYEADAWCWPRDLRFSHHADIGRAHHTTSSARGGFQSMLGFAIPLLGLCGLLGLAGITLLLPLPLARPTIALCKLTTTQAGLSVITTVSAILLCLLAAPLYDLATLHKRPEDTAGANAQRRYLPTLNSGLSACLTDTRI